MAGNNSNVLTCNQIWLSHSFGTTPGELGECMLDVYMCSLK